MASKKKSIAASNTYAARAASGRDIAVGDLFLYYGSSYIPPQMYFMEITAIEENSEHDAWVEYRKTRDGISWKEGERTKLEYLLDANSRDKYTRVPRPAGQPVAETIAVFQAAAEEAFKDPSILDLDAFEGEAGDPGSTALVGRASKQVFLDMAENLDMQRNRVAVIKAMVAHKVGQLAEIERGLLKRLDKVQRVIVVLETYLGAHEEVVQLRAGAPSPVEMPISIRQQALWMDEEAALVEAAYTRTGIRYVGDIDWQNIETFDEWLLERDHLERVLPEEKGIVAMKPSRVERERYGQGYEAARHNQANRMVYLLIRNGENVYRLYTDMQMGETLFPTEAESEKIARLLEDEATWERDREDSQVERLAAARRMLLIQGILDRTEILKPYPVARINLADPAVYENGPIRLIRDAESLLPDGRQSYDEWRKAINARVERGTRIYLVGVRSSVQGADSSRFVVWQNYYPDYPRPGLYNVEEVRSTGEYRILYLPEDKVWNQEHGRTERTRRYSFLVYSSEVLNYDGISLEDIEFYLNSRQARRDYRRVIPLLSGLRAMRLEEIEQEHHFVALLARELGCTETAVWEAVDWWKTKVIFKRPLRADDAKAWRMVRRRLAGSASDKDETE